LDNNDNECLYSTGETSELNDDLTAIIRSKPNVSVKGIGAIATVRLLKQSCAPLYNLNGSEIHDYYTLYHLVNTKKIEKVQIVQPRQAAVYDLRSTSGVVLVTPD